MTSLEIMPKQKAIVCPQCKQPILILPDLQAMNKAINDHANITHKGRTNYSKANLVNSLTQQLLLAVAKNGGVLPRKVWLLIESYFGQRRVLGVAMSEADAEQWVEAKLAKDPQGSYFHDTAKVQTERKK